MENYVLDDLRTNKQVEKKLRKAVALLRRCVKNSVAIILMGGFAKGEGTIRTVQKKVTMLSDFDLFVVTKEALTKKEGKKMQDRCAKILKTEYAKNKEHIEIDLRIIPQKKLAKVPPTLRFFELKYASQVVDGNRSILNLLPPISASLLKYEGLRLLMNRVCFVFEWYDPAKQDLHLEEREKMLAELGKNYAVCCFALNLLLHKHEPSLRKALHNFKLYTNAKNNEYGGFYKKYGNKIEQGVIMKLKHDDMLLKNGSRLQKAFKKSLTCLEATILFFEQQVNGLKSIDQFYAQNVFKHYPSYLRTYHKKKTTTEWLGGIPGLHLGLGFIAELRAALIWNKNIRKLKVWHDPAITIYAAALYLLDGLNNKKRVEFNRRKAQKKLASCYPFKKENNIKELMRITNKAFNLKFKIKEGKVIKGKNITIVVRHFI